GARPLRVTSPRLASILLCAARRSSIGHPMAPIISPERATQPGLNLQASSLISQPIGSVGNRREHRSGPSTLQHQRGVPPIAGSLALQLLGCLLLLCDRGGRRLVI